MRAPSLEIERRVPLRKFETENFASRFLLLVYRRRSLTEDNQENEGVLGKKLPEAWCLARTTESAQPLKRNFITFVSFCLIRLETLTEDNQENEVLL